MACPATGTISVERILNIVVLPLPLAEQSKQFRRADVERDAVQRGTIVVAMHESPYRYDWRSKAFILGS